MYLKVIIHSLRGHFNRGAPVVIDLQFPIEWTDGLVIAQWVFRVYHKLVWVSTIEDQIKILPQRYEVYEIVLSIFKDRFEGQINIFSQFLRDPCMDRVIREVCSVGNSGLLRYRLVQINMVGHINWNAQKSTPRRDKVDRPDARDSSFIEHVITTASLKP